MKNLIRASVAIAAFSALFVVASVASAITLTSPTGTAAGAGATFQATNIAHAKTEKHSLFTTPAGNITCDIVTLTGTLHTNGPSQITGEITTVEARGATSAVCTSPFGNVTVTPNHTSNPTHNGVASLPWCIVAGKEDKISLRGGGCTEAERPLTWTLHTPTTGTCSYQRASLTATYTTHPAAAVATVDANQTFTKTTGGGFCPSSGAFDLAFTVETDTGTPEDVYIDP